MYSVRRRLTLVLALGFGVLIAGAGFWVQDVVRERATAEFDEALLAKARAIAALTDQEEGRIEFDYTAGAMPEFERSEEPEYFQFWLDDGTVLLRSTRLTADLARTASASSEPSIFDVQLPDGRAGRLLQWAYVPRGSGQHLEPDAVPSRAPSLAPSSSESAPAPPAGGTRGLVLAVARGRERLDRLLATIGLAIHGIGGAATALAGLLVWRVLASGFRPLHSIAAQVRALHAEGLSLRIRLRHAPAELAPIVDQLNALLQRLDASFDRERRFAGNVAHELRTPIAELRTLAEVGAKWPDDRASVVGFFRDVGDIADQMEGVIGDLLLLARCQAGVERVVRSHVDLAQVIQSTWSTLAPGAATKSLRLAVHMPQDVVVESDPGKLAIVLANLLGNAVAYARPGTEIRCSAGADGTAGTAGAAGAAGAAGGDGDGDGFWLEIANAAEPLQPDDLDRLTEPFWRKDEARAAGHAGLGLSLVSALAKLLCLDLRLHQDQDGTFRARLAGLVPAASQRPAERLRRLG